MIRHLCSYCGGRDIHTPHNPPEQVYVGICINNPSGVGPMENDLARVVCDRCHTRVFDEILGEPRWKWRYDGVWIREPWLRGV